MKFPKIKFNKELMHKVLHVFYWTALIVGGTFIVVTFFVWLLFGRVRVVDENEVRWGVTYSPLASEELNLDHDETYDAVINDLKPEVLRLVAYWNRIEKEPGVYDFEELRDQIEKASDAKIPMIIAVGRRVPRYPECHEPEWAKQLPQEEQEQKILQLIRKTINMFDDEAQVVTWQIENEPFLGSFGECPPLDESFLAKEIELARSLSDKPIMTTESGELSIWLKASKYPDILGTTLYRRVIVQGTNIAVNHIFPPWYYRARSNIILKFRPQLDSVIVAELQGEPWANTKLVDADPKELERTMNPSVFEGNIDYTASVGFPEVYLWGVEWWYYEMTQNGNDYYWERSKQLFQ